MKTKRLPLILIISFLVLAALAAAGYFLLKDKLFTSSDNTLGGDSGGGPVGGEDSSLVGNQSNATCASSDECKVQGVINCGDAEPFCSNGFCSCKSVSQGGSSPQPAGFVSMSCSESLDFLETINEATFNPPAYENQTIKTMVESEKGQTVIEMLRYTDDNYDIILAAMDSGDTCIVVGGEICYCGK